MTRRYLNQATIKKAASKKAAQYLFRCVDVVLVSDFIVLFYSTAKRFSSTVESTAGGLFAPLLRLVMRFYFDIVCKVTKAKIELSGEL
jgi:hypothetical protein